MCKPGRTPGQSPGHGQRQPAPQLICLLGAAVLLAVAGLALRETWAVGAHVGQEEGIILLRCPGGANTCDGSDPPYGSTMLDRGAGQARVEGTETGALALVRARALARPTHTPPPPRQQLSSEAPATAAPAVTPSSRASIRSGSAAIAGVAAPVSAVAPAHPLTVEKDGSQDHTYSTLRVSLASAHTAKNPPWETPPLPTEEPDAKVLYVPGCAAQKPPTFAKCAITSCAHMHAMWRPAGIGCCDGP